MLTSTDMYRVQAQDTLYVKVKLDQDENQLFHPYFPKKNETSINPSKDTHYVSAQKV